MDNKAEFEGIHPSWRPVLDDAKFETIMRDLPETGLAPPRGQILNAFKHFPLDSWKENLGRLESKPDRMGFST